jgi:hypothetical protein
MPRLVQIGGGQRTHLRADGTGPVPVGRSRCELSRDGSFDPYVLKDRTTESRAREIAGGEPTCEWCRTRNLPA